MRILHLSDTHLGRTDGPDIPGADGADGANGADGTAALRLLLAEAAHLDGLDAVVVTGDVADDGSRAAYERVRELLGGYAQERGAQLFFAVGNHDERAAFAEVLGSGHGAPDAVYPGQAGERAAVSTVAGWRLVTLDSLVPGKGYGLLGPGQLGWLREVLADPAPQGTVLAFHHPPIGWDVEVQRVLGLQDTAELADAIRGTDVHLVLCGHFHLQLLGRLEQAAVWVTPGVLSRIDLTARPGTERAVHGPSASLIDLGGPHSPLIHTLHARHPRMGATVYEADEEKLRQVLTDLGPSVA